MKEKLKSKRTLLATLSNQAKSLYAEMDAAGDKVTAEDRSKFANLVADGKAVRAEVEQLETLIANDELAGGSDEELKSRTQDTPGQPTPIRKSWGAQVVASKQFKQNNRAGMDRVPVGGTVKGLLTGLAGQTGTLSVQAQRLPDIQSLPRRPLSILNYINISETSSNAVEYVEMGSRTNAAAIVGEAGTTGGATLKPESSLTFTVKTAGVKTIATWIPATRQILEDEPRLRDMVDDELTFMLQEALETQIISGDGTGQNFTGILNTSGIQTRVHRTSGRDFDAADTVADTLRRSLTDLQLEFYDADVILTHPVTTELLELEKDTTGQYIRVFDPVSMTVWRKPVVPTMSVPDGTAITAQAKLAATLWDRATTEILVGQPANYFLQNMVAVLAELRAAFGVTRPKAIEKTTGLNP